jgi:hypothetical protein
MTLPAPLKQKQLRDLNIECGNLQVALNQTQQCLQHAMKLLEQTYQRKRSQILAAHDETESIL